MDSENGRMNEKNVFDRVLDVPSVRLADGRIARQPAEPVHQNDPK